jgi:hypothetical protein
MVIITKSFMAGIGRFLEYFRGLAGVAGHVDAGAADR